MKQAEAVWAVALFGPVTAREVAELLVGENASSGQASTALYTTYEEGLLVRREAADKRGYEYKLATPQTVEEWEHGEMYDDESGEP
jgi:hypothetical protein